MNQTGLHFVAEQVYKSFGVTKALKGMHLELRHGQILGLIGENGSGKSTLTSIISGIQKADSGEFFYEGAPYHVADSLEANSRGICMILQEKGTFDGLSVARNIFIGKENLFSKGGILNNRKMNQAAQEVLNDIGANRISAGMPVDLLTFEDRKLVELARAMYMDPKILIVDETTTALSREGRSILYGILQRMKKAGNSVIFISHDLDEIMEVCDTLTILRDGDYIDTIEKENYDAATIRRLMVGRDVADNFYRNDYVSCKTDEVVLRMQHVYTPVLRDVTFELKKGEILGFGGLADCGMHVVGSLAFGLQPPDLGEVRGVNGKVIDSPITATKQKIAYISKNRDAESLMISANIKDNICLASYGKLAKHTFISPKREKQFVNENAAVLEVKMRDMDQYVLELSGGNKQKVALAKWLGFGADVFIMDCPTRGIDIGVKSNIYKLMMDLKEQGKSIILISEELPEVIGMSDRILILKNGKITGEFLREERVTDVALIDYMI